MVTRENSSMRQRKTPSHFHKQSMAISASSEKTPCLRLIKWNTNKRLPPHRKRKNKFQHQPGLNVFPAAAPRSSSLFAPPPPQPPTLDVSRCCGMRRGTRWLSRIFSSTTRAAVELGFPPGARQLLLWSARGAPRDLMSYPTPQERIATALGRAWRHLTSPDLS